MTKCSICGKETKMYSNSDKTMLPIGWKEVWIKDKERRIYKVEHYCRSCKPKKTNEY